LDLNLSAFIYKALNFQTCISSFPYPMSTELVSALSFKVTPCQLK